MQINWWLNPVWIIIIVNWKWRVSWNVWIKVILNISAPKCQYIIEFSPKTLKIQKHLRWCLPWFGKPGNATSVLGLQEEISINRLSAGFLPRSFYLKCLSKMVWSGLNRRNNCIFYFFAMWSLLFKDQCKGITPVSETGS